MPLFSYEAKRGPHEIVKGSIEADSEKTAVEKLAIQGVVPLSIKKVRQSSIHASLKFTAFQRVNLRDVYMFTYQLVDLLRSGLPLLKSLETVATQIENVKLVEVINSVQNSVKEGKNFSQSLAEFPKIFPAFYVNMVRAGEAGGKLESVLEQLGITIEKENDLRNKVLQSLAYPVLISLVGLATIVVILLFVIPKLQTMYTDLGQSLPMITILVIKVSSFLLHFWWLLMAVLIGAGLMLRRYMQAEKTGVIVDAVVDYVPWWGKVIYKEEITRFTRNLGMLLASGVAFLEALLITKNTVRSIKLQNEIIRLHARIKEGSKLYSAMAEKKRFPMFVVNMISTGEESGSLDAALERVATSYEKDIDGQIKVITSLVEPFLILSVGIIVGIIVISMLLPIFQINIFVQ